MFSIKPVRWLKKMYGYLKKIASKKTSMLDYSAYRKACERAATDDAAFTEFKSDPDYRIATEHGDQSSVDVHYEAVRDRHPELLSRAEDFRKNDMVGNPYTFIPSNHFCAGQWSSTTLRYMLVLGELIKHNLIDSGSKVVEVGAGYGGQFKITQVLFTNLSWINVDLPETCLLSKKYIPDISVVRSDESHKCSNEKYDLFLSCFAFSELSRKMQLEYYENIIKNCNRGFIVWNDMQQDFDHICYDEFESFLEGKGFRLTIEHNELGRVIIFANIGYI